MAFKVEENGKGGYLISIGTGKRYTAKDLSSVARGLMHYFRKDVHVDDKWDYQAHIKHNEECNCCPLCTPKNPKSRKTG
jgi:hypothetical protein